MIFIPLIVDIKMKPTPQAQGGNVQYCPQTVTMVSGNIRSPDNDILKYPNTVEIKNTKQTLTTWPAQTQA
jgi:hypothetical protein